MESGGRDGRRLSLKSGSKEDYGAAFKVRPTTAAAILIPLTPSTLRGCSAIESF